MLNHHARRLIVRLMILFAMVAALLWVSPGTVERRALASTPTHQVTPASSPNFGSPRGCIVVFRPDGQCVLVCCYGGYCSESEC